MVQLVVFYGANARLARKIGVPVFIDGDTGEIVISPRLAVSPYPVSALRHRASLTPPGCSDGTTAG